MFQSLRKGSPIYLFDKTNINAEMGEVSRVENPADQFGNPIFINGLMQPKVAFIDIHALFNGTEKTFSHVNADCSITDSGKEGAIICDNLQEFIAAITSYAKSSERALSEMDKHRVIVEKCGAILNELDPKRKAEKEQAEEIASLKRQMANIENMLSKALNLNKEVTQ